MDVLVIGGTSGMGHQLAAEYVARGARVTISGRNEQRAAAQAAELGGDTRSITLELSEPRAVGPGLSEVEHVDRLALVAVDRDENSVADYDLDRAVALVTLKLVGYTEVVHQLVGRLAPDASILLFGGLAKDRPIIPDRPRSRR